MRTFLNMTVEYKVWEVFFILFTAVGVNNFIRTFFDELKK